MTGPYILFASIALYALMVRASAKYKIGPVFSAMAVVLLPFILAKYVWYIYLTGYDLSLEQLVSWSDVVILLVQLATALLVFYKLQQNENSIEAWLFWGGVGLVCIYFAAPSFVRFILA